VNHGEFKFSLEFLGLFVKFSIMSISILWLDITTMKGNFSLKQIAKLIISMLKISF
jgi:hypothetical protein